MNTDERTLAVERWGDMVWRLALARTANVSDAEDVFQEVFLRYFRSEDKLTGDERRKNWLIRCTLNRCSSLFSSPWRRKTVPLETAARIGVEDEYREVYAAVLALPAKYRAPVHLYYYDGLSVAEIADTLSLPPGTVKSHLSKARELLRDALKGDWNDGTI
ncbi:MAG: RNA polymerase sigma factor [Oscillospiraceae bacterium]|nr:RNA polymerase sigma factor [Oscillospiraceae bacterium]